jgi:transposase
MAKPYSQDLLDRVIDAVKRGEMSRRVAARRYEISESVERSGKPTRLVTEMFFWARR